LKYLEFFLYGLIQGLTEFIPVSSTAHLKVISHFLGLNDPGISVSAIIQLGSVFAIIYFFRKDILNGDNLYFKSKLNILRKIFVSIFIGTIPILLLGGFVKFFIHNFFNTVLRSNFSIAIISLLMAMFMYFADISKSKFKNIGNHNFVDSLLIGIAQALAIVPGVSRSGITISTALLSGWERREAAKFSFLLGIPAISISAIIELFFTSSQLDKVSFLPLVVGLITSFFSSLFALDFFLKYISSKGIKIFVFYRLFLGILILLNL